MARLGSPIANIANFSFRGLEVAEPIKSASRFLRISVRFEPSHVIAARIPEEWSHSSTRFRSVKTRSGG